MRRSGKRRRDSSAAEEIAGNEDLLTQILLRLPLKSLLRFESVSKKWLSLISHPHFSQNYTRNPNYEPSGLLFSHHKAGFQFLPFNGDGDRAEVRHLYPNERGIRILQSSNGLLMCSSSISSYPQYENYICNPMTRQVTTIRFPRPKIGGAVVAVNLAFDPLKSPHYKLLCIRVMDEETVAFRIDIYSSETGSWRLPISGKPLIFTAPQNISLRVPVYWRGAIHWYTDQDTSLYFNTDTECLKTMPMPPFNEGFNFNNVRYFGESRGHLHLIAINKPYLATELDIWELETDYSGWFVQYHVNLATVTVAFPPDVTWIALVGTDAYSILCVARAVKEENSTLVLFISGKAISYNLHENTSKKLYDLVPCISPAHVELSYERVALNYEWCDAHQYIETLFRV